MDTEDLEYNAFFSGLKKRFPKLYEKIEESCLTVCVPHSKVLHNFKPSLQFFEKYVLQPSPFFKNEWESISKPPLKCKLQDGNILLVTLPSSEKVNVKILFEESYYNSQLQAHRVICVDNLFESNPSGKLQIQDTAGTSIFDSRSTYKENEGFLVTYTSCMKPLFDRAKEFNESYMVVPGYIDHLVERLQSLRDELREIAFASPRLASVRTDPRLPTSIDDAIECCLFEKVLFFFVMFIFRTFKAHMNRSLRKLSRLLRCRMKRKPENSSRVFFERPAFLSKRLAACFRHVICRLLFRHCVQ